MFNQNNGQNQWKDRISWFSKNSSAHPDLVSIWQNGDPATKTKAINALIISNNFEHYSKQFASDDLYRKAFGLGFKEIARVCKDSIVKSTRGDLFNDWACLTPDDAVYFVERVYKEDKKPKSLTEDEEEKLDESFDSYGTVDLVVSKRRFNCRPLPHTVNLESIGELLKASQFSDDQKVDLLSSSLAHHRDKKSLEIIKRLVTSELRLLTVDQHFLKYVSDESGEMYKKIHRGIINNLIVSPELLAELKRQFGLHWSPSVSSTQSSYSPFYKLEGYLTKDIKVYSCEGLKTGEIYCVYKNPDSEDDHSVVFGTLNPLALSLDYIGGAPEDYGTFCDTSDFFPINSDFIRKIQIKGN